jgi:hypothetical protein
VELLKQTIKTAGELKVREAVAERLASFGQVENLSMFEAGDQEHARVIVVTMATPQQAVAVANELGLASFGDRSLIITV